MFLKKKLYLKNSTVVVIFFFSLFFNQYFGNRGVFPLDSFIESPIQRMEIDGKPEEINEVHQELIDVTKKIAGEHWKVSSIERFKFYEEAKKAYAIITTNETRPFGCFIFTKGVVKPDGSVWVIDK